MIWHDTLMKTDIDFSSMFMSINTWSETSSISGTCQLYNDTSGGLGKPDVWFETWSFGDNLKHGKLLTT